MIKKMFNAHIKDALIGPQGPTPFISPGACDA